MAYSQLTNSKISPDLIDSYKAAEYRANIHTNTTTLRIDQYSASLNEIFLISNHQYAAFITASNPLSQQLKPHVNQTRNTQLRKVLTQYTNLIFEGASIDPTKLWPAEQSFLALGLNIKVAKVLGKQFDQNAVVWIDTDAIPRLILLR